MVRTTSEQPVEKMKKPIHVGDIVYKVLVTFAMLFFAASFVIVLCWMMFSSLRPAKLFGQSPFKFWDMSGASWNNYRQVFQVKCARTDMWGMLKNSLILIVGTTILQAFIPVITGYVIARYKTHINNFVVNLVIVSMVVPTIGSMTTTYRFIYSIDLYGSFWAIFLMNAGGLGFSMLLYRNYFASISWEYAESAFIDGASNIRVFFSIMYPQAKPLVVSMAILNVIGVWNDYLTPYLYLPKKPTVAYGVYYITKQANTNYPKAFAAMSFMTIFVLVIYACFSKTIMSSMSVGGLKG